MPTDPLPVVIEDALPPEREAALLDWLIELAEQEQPEERAA